MVWAFCPLSRFRSWKKKTDPFQARIGRGSRVSKTRTESGWFVGRLGNTLPCEAIPATARRWRAGACRSRANRRYHDGGSQAGRQVRQMWLRCSYGTRMAKARIHAFPKPKHHLPTCKVSWQPGGKPSLHLWPAEPSQRSTTFTILKFGMPKPESCGHARPMLSIRGPGCFAEWRGRAPILTGDTFLSLRPCFGPARKQCF